MKLTYLVLVTALLLGLVTQLNAIGSPPQKSLPRALPGEAWLSTPEGPWAFWFPVRVTGSTREEAAHKLSEVICYDELGFIYCGDER